MVILQHRRKNFRIIAPSGGGTDPYFANVVLLLHCDGTNGSATILDSSSLAKTVTAAGNAQLSTSAPKFGSAALLCDGSGDSVSIAHSADLDFAGDFSIEFWLKWTNFLGYQTVLEKGYVGAGGLILQTGLNDGRINIYISGSIVGTESDAPSIDSWTFYQLVRSGSTLKLIRNGLEKISATNSTNLSAAAPLCFGVRYSDNTYGFNGRYDDIRVTKDVARSNTIPSASFPDL